MEETILKGKTANLKYGINPQDGKLNFKFSGLDSLPKKDADLTFLFEQILDMKDTITSFVGNETIEYAKKEVFTLETCISVYLIDYIKSGNDLTHVTPIMLQTIYKSDEISKEFEKINDEIVFAQDKDVFFEKENSAISLIHEAFKINEESYDKDFIKEYNAKYHPENVEKEERIILSNKEVEELENKEDDIKEELKDVVEDENEINNNENSDVIEIEESSNSSYRSSIKGIVFDDEDEIKEDDHIVIE